MDSGELPPLNWLRAFEASARHLSFTQAAEELALTQSAISQQIKGLETYLRTPLFLRRARGIELTDAGRAYLPTLEGALAQIADVTRMIRGGQGDAELTIQTNMAFSINWLAPRLGDFLSTHPWIRLNVVNVLWPLELVRPFSTVEIRFGSGLWERPGIRKLCDASAYPVCAPTAVSSLQKPEDIFGYRLVDCAGISGGWPGWLKQAGAAMPDPAPIIHQASTYVMVFAMVEAQGFIGLGHDVICDTALASGRLAKPFDLSIPLSEGYYLIPPTAGENEAARLFSDWLEQAFSQTAA